ncbi:MULTISPECIES: NAD-dependent epimerase/dehydratase family protein [unclassified Mucilaginibacter]|uniref:NAD-dependent epimerase/dehydratase family protein n=1 Tax=unclassified Mucilaginibacter TaxID=2617802 RepID=UPI002AC95745|nr:MULTISPECIES: NAD-dependent epimerase/dehydratase family protein [unclassified Mucilaginibacter]MEB0262960.1 NAD-dependent epimerase/dehydratase family protein [Mucilaginibacter sp. 10I4]MEB0277545.1 NAD-dependent epimerase/dehydratase family protein [Mucilaginibacter sp. 10B2]WPX24826.1 NAD-dependent epimerase/dehydratase family protein [Mucilaginibacter sp. 5C4]
MQKVLLTGGHGFLGNEIYKYLKTDCDISVLTLGRSVNNDIIADVSSSSLSLPSDINIVVHVAGKAHSIPKTPTEIQEFVDVNFQGTKNLCEALQNRAKALKSFIFISTVAVYGLNSGKLITEDSPLNGNTPYAQSKIMAEEFLRNWASRNGVILGILRLPLIAGPNPPGNLGAMINGIKKGKYLSIGKANARKSIVWAEDIAKIISVIANKGGIYNLTDGYHPSFNELEKAISTALKKPYPPKISLFLARFIARLGDLIGSKSPINSSKLSKVLSTLTFSDNKAREELGWNPTTVTDKIYLIINSNNLSK